ncbi:hypothetical protein HMN09_00326900 [Mycena chlorophos]|uniref:Uncharacterized protein n=1 Tax=Mycena chlorophos TaxID=658473 RepID=A0A8H6TK60_MYCCL|nr:hypothetical protein HMN09_00326900 [Mycena chlorophos]
MTLDPGGHCLAIGCGRPTTDALCERQMCRGHCSKVGPCRCKPHQKEYEKKQQQQQNAARPASATIPAAATTVIPSDAALLPLLSTPQPLPSVAQAARFLAALNSIHGMDRAQVQAVVQERLASASSLPLINSAANEHAVPPLLLWDSHTPSLLSPSHAMDVPNSFAEHDLPENDGFVFSASNISQRPSLEPERVPTPPFPPSTQPHTSAALQPAAPTPKKRRNRLPALSMNDDWNDDNGVSQTEPLHIRQESPTKKKVINNNNLTKRFYFVGFATPGKAPHTSVVDASVSWPIWSLADGGEDVGALFEGLVDDAKAEMWVASKREWFAVPRDMEHRVTTDCTLIFRRRGEVWDNAELEAIINTRFLPPPPPHYRYNLPAQRKALATAYKTLPSTPTVPLLRLPNPDGEILHEPALSSPLKRALQLVEDHEDNQRPATRARLTIDTTTSAICSTVPSAPPSPWSAATPSSASPSPLPSPFPSTIQPNPPGLTLAVSAPAPALPSGFGNMYVVDVVAGFHKMDELRADKSLDLEARFKRAFPTRKFNGNTYRDNARKWNNAPMGFAGCCDESGADTGRTLATFYKLFNQNIALY